MKIFVGYCLAFFEMGPIEKHRQRKSEKTGTHGRPATLISDFVVDASIESMQESFHEFREHPSAWQRGNETRFS